MKPRPLIAGNWKMHKTIAEALQLVDGIEPFVTDDGPEVAVAPPFTALHAVSQRLAETSIALAAQNVFYESAGAFTGEVAPAMLVDLKCQYAIVGHSERRQLFGETDETVLKRARAALGHKLSPIICVGETLTEREAGRTLDVVARQVRGALLGFSQADGSRIVIAYEPVWAIGTGKVATPGQAQDVHAAIRQMLVDQFGAVVGRGIRLLYGGSVKPDNARELLGQDDIDGALVGGASLKAEEFGRIIAAAG